MCVRARVCVCVCVTHVCVCVQFLVKWTSAVKFPPDQKLGQVYQVHNERSGAKSQYRLVCERACQACHVCVLAVCVSVVCELAVVRVLSGT